MGTTRIPINQAVLRGSGGSATTAPMAKRKGRPKTKVAKNDRVSVRVTKTRRSRYEEAAERAGQSLTDWARRILDEGAERELREE